MSSCEEGKEEILTHNSMRLMFNLLPKRIWTLLCIMMAICWGILSIYDKQIHELSLA